VANHGANTLSMPEPAVGDESHSDVLVRPCVLDAPRAKRGLCIGSIADPAADHSVPPDALPTQDEKIGRSRAKGSDSKHPAGGHATCSRTLF
jgi:hypothetical protein